MRKASCYTCKTRPIFLHQGRLWAAPRLSAEKPAIIQNKNNSLDVTLYPSDDLKALEIELLASLHKVGVWAFMKFKVNPAMVIFGSIIISISIALVLGILATYEDVFKTLLIKKELSEWEGGVLGITTLFVVVGIGFFPSILSSGEDGKVKEIVHSWYNKEDRVRRRLKHALQALCISEHMTISLWNPCAFPEDSWVWRSLVPAIFDLNMPITIHIKIDERDAFFNAARVIDNKIEFTQLMEDTCPRLPENLAHINLNEIQNLLSSSEKLLLEVFLVLSTYNTPSTWGNDEKTAKLHGLISLDLASFVVSRYVGNKTSFHEDIDAKYLYTFFRRCVVDYLLIQPFVDSGDRYWRLADGVMTHLSMERVRQRHQYLQNHVETEYFEVIQNISDPVGLLIAFALLDNNNSSIKLKMSMLAAMIERSRTAESYFLMGYFRSIKESYASTITDFDSSDFLRLLPITSLQQLIPLLERAGHFQDAIATADFLRPINSNTYDLIKARLLERLGQYRSALELIEQLNQSTKDVPNLDVEQTMEFQLKFWLIASWIIVSGRLSEYMDAGKTYLQHAQAAFDKLRSEGKNCSPTHLWHYYNNMAQYFEWEENFSLCIDNHLICQKLPGIELKWISGTNVNLGIAYRKRFKNAHNKDDLDRALAFGIKGVQIKMEIGDNDELPIALHNLALSQLLHYKANNDQDTLKSARENAIEGLALLNDTKSDKKKGPLLAEALVSEKLLGNESEIFSLSSELSSWQATNQNPDDSSAVAEIMAILDRKMDS